MAHHLLSPVSWDLPHYLWSLKRRALSRGWQDESPIKPPQPSKTVTVEDSFKSCASPAAAAHVMKVLAPDLLARLREEHEVRHVVCLDYGALSGRVATWQYCFLSCAARIISKLHIYRTEAVRFQANAGHDAIRNHYQQITLCEQSTIAAAGHLCERSFMYLNISTCNHEYKQYEFHPLCCAYHPMYVPSHLLCSKISTGELVWVVCNSVCAS